MDIKHILKRVESLFSTSEYLTRLSEMEEISAFCMPGYQDFTSSNSPAVFDQRRDIDVSPSLYAKSLATTIFNGLVSPGTKWFRYKFKEDNVSEELQKELSDFSDTVLHEFTRSGSSFSSQFFSVAESAVVFGPGVLATQYTSGKGISFKAIPISQVAIAENYEGEVDTVIRKFKMTARQVMQQWPDYASSDLKRTFDRDPDCEVEIAHCVWPAKEGKKYDYYYVDITHQEVIDYYQEKHLDIQVFRWAKHAGETYGHGQGKLALGFMRSTTKARRASGSILEWAAKPIIEITDDIPGLSNLRKGQTNPVRPGSLVQSLKRDGTSNMKVTFGGGDVQAGQIFYATEQDSLKKAFFADKIELPQDQTRRTAFEVAAMQREEVKYLAPFISNLENTLKATVETVTKIMKENGKLKDFDIDMKDIELELLSPLARQLKMEDARALNTFLQMALGFINISPESVATIDVDFALKVLAESTGTPLEILKSEERVKEMRQAQAEAAQQQQAAETGLAGSQIFKNLQGVE